MHSFSRSFVAIVLLIGGLLVGCDKGHKASDFTPDENKAKTTLESALNHWKNGGSTGTIADTSPSIEVIDTKWKAGQKIKGFEITAEEPFSGTGARIFKVRLELTSGKSEDTKYAVLGINPVLIYRDEDYQKLSGTGK